MEPPIKRAKAATGPSFQIKAILSDEYDKDIPLENVYVSKICNKKEIFNIMQELAQYLPLPGLQHLKRVRQNEIIICQVTDLKESDSLEKFLMRLELSNLVVDNICANVEEKLVPSAGAKLRWQQEKIQKYWSCKFHPNNYLESVYNGKNFTTAENHFHTKIADLLLRLSCDLENQRPMAICVDPRTQSIVAIASSNSQINPIKHSPMMLIDAVAYTQDGGAWCKSDGLYLTDDTKTQTTMCGIQKRYFDYIKSEDCFKVLTFGAERSKECDKILAINSALAPDDDNLSKYGPYLCTGYDIYLSDEPCLMCAMALVHSRARRIFYVRASKNGVLCTQFKLHDVKELNHHYEVFHCVQLN